MTIAFPTSPAPAACTPFLKDFGAVMEPFLGGPSTRINRVGTRFGVRVTMPSLRSETDGRLIVSRLLQARLDRLLMRWPGLDMEPGAPGAPVAAAATAGGSVLPISGLTAGYAVREGQFFSLIHGGRRYLHQFTAAVAANAAGAMTATLFPPLRVAVAAGDALEIALPMIEGFVLPGDELNWEMALARRVNLSFSVVEAA